MGLTEKYTPGFGIIVSIAESRELIKRLFDITVPAEDDDEFFEILPDVKSTKYSLIRLPHDISESFGKGTYVFIGVVGEPLETQFGYSQRFSRKTKDEEPKRLGFGEGQMVKWSKIKETYDALEEELESEFEPIDEYDGEFYFLPDDCLCCT